NTAEVYTQKINLEQGKKHTIHAVDMMIDCLDIYVSAQPDSVATILGQVYLSPYPVWDSAIISEFGPMGPMASDPSILYSAKFQFTYDPADPAGPAGVSQLTKLREFPTETIAAGESFDFYTDHMYMTVFIFSLTGTDTTIQNSHISMLVQLDDKEVNEIEHFMGAYAEFLEAQRKRLLMETAMRNSTGFENYSGYWFPSANYGGIRPELTVRGDVIGQFLTSNAYDPETFRTQDSYRAIDSQARQMQSYNEAFGGTVPILQDGAPDWLRFVRSEQFMMEERDVFPARHVDLVTQAVVMV
ncbi:MAG: hypothetical protein ACYS8I_12775, partial [Planctomycetota bacterium]